MIEQIADIMWLFGAPGEIRTPDPQIRSLVLYPAELRAHTKPLARGLASRSFEPAAT